MKKSRPGGHEGRKEKAMEQKIKGYFISPEKKGHGVIELENTLDSLYQLIGCSLIDIMTRKIGRDDHYYTIVVDDEGLLTDNPFISAADSQGNPMSVGTLFVCNTDKEGNLSSLTGEELTIVERNILYCTTGRHRDCLRPILLNCEY